MLMFLLDLKRQWHNKQAKKNHAKSRKIYMPKKAE